MGGSEHPRRAALAEAKEVNAGVHLGVPGVPDVHSRNAENHCSCIQCSASNYLNYFGF
jgi:hypothetical protein